MEQSAWRLSFEVFPPRAESGRAALQETVSELARFAPAFFSVTYGAGGSTREGTMETVRRIAGLGEDVAPHISFGNDDEQAMAKMLDAYAALGIKRLVVLRGDAAPVSGKEPRSVSARELVAFVRRHSKRHFEIEVAAYPEVHPLAAGYARNCADLLGKIEAGADSAITQYFFNPDAYFYYLEACQKIGIDAPVIPGILVIKDVSGLMAFSKKCGAEVPRWLERRLADFQQDDQACENFVLDFLETHCRRLLAGGAPGLHLYTLNESRRASALCQRLASY